MVAKKEKSKPDSELKQEQAGEEEKAEAGTSADTSQTEAAAEKQTEQDGEKQPDSPAEDSEQETAELENDLEKKLAEITDRLQRTMAEFDNFRKRTEKEKAARYEIGARSVIEKILPVLDNFERGLGGLTEEQKNAFSEGMDKVYRQLVTTLEEMDVKPIEALGQEFNPDLHNAVMHVEDESVGENIIVEEFQKGYTYKGGVVRYSMVKVAN